MDELKNIWKQIKSETNGFTDMDREDLRKAIEEQSKGPVAKLKKQVFTKWVLCIVFTVLIAVGIPFVTVLISQILLLVLLAAYIVGDVLLYNEYKWLQKATDMSTDVRSALQLYYERVRKVLRYEELIGLLLYPISLPAGFFFGLKLGSPDKEIMQEPKQWIALIISMIVLLPLSHLLTRWLNKMAFGKYLKQLKQNIDELDKL